MSMVSPSPSIKKQSYPHSTVPPRQINFNAMLSVETVCAAAVVARTQSREIVPKCKHANLALVRPQLFQSHTWKGEEGRHGLSRQWDIKLAWCVLLFNWPWNINRFGIHWLTFDWGETEEPASDVCNWIVAASADIMSKRCVAYFYLFIYLLRL